MVSKPSKSSKTNGNKQKNAPSTSNGNDEDEKNKEDRSILRQPMDIGIRGVRDLVKALAGGTQEFQDILLNECSIIYECKICRNLFRSLANFISHKRVYCINRFHYFTHGFSDLQNERKPEIVHERKVIVEPEMPQNNPQIEIENEAWVTSNKAVEITTETENNTCIVPPQIKSEPYRITRKRDIAKIVDGLSKKGGKEVVKTSQDVPGSVFYSDIAEKVKLRRNAKQKPVIELENVSDTCNGVFQTVKENVNDSNLDSMRVQVAELNGVVAKNQAILQENGTFTVTSEKLEESDLSNMDKHKCSFCDAQFITLQTLNRHVSMYHRKLICFQCPLCKEFFPSPTSVYRHLSKAHHRSEQQIRRLRPQILSKASERKLLQPSPKIIPDINGDLKTLEKEKEKWINNFEGALRCGTCGKSFNRRAVLSVHLASCKERLPQKPAITVPTTKPIVAMQQSSKPVLELQSPKPETIVQPPKIAMPVQPSKLLLPTQPRKLMVPWQPPKPVIGIPPPKPTHDSQLDKPKAAVKPTSLLKIMPPKAVPKLRKTTSPVKSGILVRKDYGKKLTSNSLNSSPSQTNCFYPNDDFSWRHNKVEVLVRKLDSKTMSDLKKSINGTVSVNNNKSFLNNKNKAEKSIQRKVEEPKKEKKVKVEKEEKLIQQTVEEAEKQPDLKTTKTSEENNEKDGSSTPDVASVKSERLSPVDSVSSTVSSTKTLPYQLRKKKKKSDDEGSSEMEVTSNDDTDKNNDDAKNDSNIENEGGQYPVEKVESVLRRTKRARTLVKNKEFIYNIKKLPPSAKCRTKAIKKAVKHLNYNGSMLLLHKNLSLLKNNGDSKLIKFFPRLL